MEQLTKRDFNELALETLEHRTGWPAPKDPTHEEEEEYRAKAWRSYKVDIENRDEWGTATQATEVPEGEEPDM
jgi:hypothetical protein